MPELDDAALAAIEIRRLPALATESYDGFERLADAAGLETAIDDAYEAGWDQGREDILALLAALRQERERVRVLTASEAELPPIADAFGHMATRAERAEAEAERLRAALEGLMVPHADCGRCDCGKLRPGCEDHFSDCPYAIGRAALAGR